MYDWVYEWALRHCRFVYNTFIDEIEHCICGSTPTDDL